MEKSVTVQCPFCGQFSNVTLDALVEEHQLVTDCEICCRPFEVIIECSDGEIVSANVFDA